MGRNLNYFKKELLREHATQGTDLYPMFVRPKKDGTYRMILNLRSQ